jgi:hypothetical protein
VTRGPFQKQTEIIPDTVALWIYEMTPKTGIFDLLDVVIVPLINISSI